MPYFKTRDGCSLFYETQGFDSTKPVVVFLNGTMLTTVYWKTHANALEDRFRVLLYDARAQGKSDLGQGGLSLEGHVDDFAELLDCLGVQKAHLVGLSHGAKVALAYAVHSPEHVDRLVLCSLGATSTSRSRLLVRSWQEILNSVGLEAMARVALPIVFGESFLRQQKRILPTIVKAMVKRNTKESLLAQLEAMNTYPPPAEIAPSVRTPCLVISASDDPLVTEEGAKELAVLCRGHHRHVNGVGHSVPSEAPELFIEAVEAFLGKG